MNNEQILKQMIELYGEIQTKLSVHPVSTEFKSRFIAEMESLLFMAFKEDHPIRTYFVQIRKNKSNPPEHLGELFGIFQAGMNLLKIQKEHL